MNDKPPQRGFESNLKKTFEEICKYACEVIGVEHSGFVRFDNTQEIGKVIAQYPDFPGLIGQVVKLKGVPPEEELLRSLEPLIIEDVENAQDLGDVRTLLRTYDIQSICIVAVKFRDAIVGSFSFDSIGKKRKFGPDEIKACKALAAQASSDFEKAQLGDWLDSFQHATVAITVEREADSLLGAIVKQIEPLFNAQSLGIYLRGPDQFGKDTLRLAASSDPKLIGNLLKRHEGMGWQIIEGNDDFIATPRYDDYPHRVPAYAGIFGSVLEVPLLRRQERVGVVYLSDFPGRQFTEFDATLLQRFADIAVIALQYCDIAARMKRVSIAITEIFRGFDSGNLQSRLTHIALTATNILNAEMCGVFRIDNPRTIVLQASYGHTEGGFTPERPFEIRDEPGSGLTGAVAARLITWHKSYSAARESAGDTITKEANLVFNSCGWALTQDPAVKGTPDATPTGACHSLLAVPLITRSEGTEQVTGMLRISNKKGVDGLSRDSICFSDEDELVLRFFADAAAVSIETAKLFEERQKLSNRLAKEKDAYQAVLAEADKHRELFSQERRKSTTLESLYDASKLLAGSLEFSSILNQLAEKTWRVSETLGCKSNIVAIMLFERGKAWIHATYPSDALQGMAREVADGIDLEPSRGKRGIVGRAYRDRQSLYANNVATDLDYREIDHDTRSQLVVLIGREGSPDQPPVGAISVESPIRYAFNDESLRVFKSLAALVNDSIKNARQFSAIEHASYREANLRDLALYYVKCGVLFHNQKGHVLTIKSEAEKLKEASQNPDANLLIPKLAETIFNQSQSLELLSDTEHTRIIWTELGFEDLARDWEKRISLKKGLQSINIDVSYSEESGKKVFVDQLLMRHVVMIFVDNSINAMQAMPNKAIRIHITNMVPGFCSIVISDTGKGMNKERWEEISAGKNPAYADTRPRNGLRTALLVITGFGGEIRLVDSRKNEGTAFEIRIPLLKLK